MAVLSPGDTVLGMDLSHGGHLTHGSPVNISGILYNFVAYGVDKETGKINYDEVLRIAKECKPKMIVAGASAYSREIDFKRFGEIAQEVGADAHGRHGSHRWFSCYRTPQQPGSLADFVTTTTHKTFTWTSWW